MDDLKQDFQQNIREIFKELKMQPIISKVYLSRITFFNGGVSLILIIIGIILIYFSIMNRNSLEEFSVIPFILGVIDLFFASFYFYNSVGYSLHINSANIEYKKFNKNVFKNNIRYTDIEYKKGFFYEYYKISNINDRKESVIIPSFIFSKKDFLDIKDSFSKLNKLKQILKLYQE